LPFDLIYFKRRFTSVSKVEGVLCVLWNLIVESNCTICRSNSEVSILSTGDTREAIIRTVYLLFNGCTSNLIFLGYSRIHKEDILAINWIERLVIVKISILSLIADILDTISHVLINCLQLNWQNKKQNEKDYYGET